MDLKYWGEKCLFKLVSEIGKLVKLDQATTYKDRLNFARILVEVMVDQHFSNSISFENEKGCIIKQMVGYERKPITCENCHGIGHEVEQCTQRQRKKKQIWVERNKPTLEAGGFQKVSMGKV